MYGKHFESMYEGSMVGAGAVVFAVWGYVIAHYKLDKEVGAQVELNPKLLGFVLGEDEGLVKSAIEKLCEPDPASRTKAEGGKRLVRIGEYSYRVVNGPKYTELRNEESRREQNRVAQARHRQKKGKVVMGLSGKPLVVGKGESIQGVIKRDVDECPITKADKAEVAVLPESKGKTLCEVFAEEDKAAGEISLEPRDE